MRFELEPYNRNVPAEAIRADMCRVARELGKPGITAAEYRQHGQFSPDVARRRFGSWVKALDAAGLGHNRTMTVSPDECIEDLLRVADEIGKRAVTSREYVERGKYSVGPFERNFGSWFGALEAAGLERTRTLGVTNEEYFENLELMWVALGRQPHYAEVQKPFSRYSAGAYEQRFGGWRKALEAFVAYVNDESSERVQPSPVPQQLPQHDRPLPQHKTARAISWRLRFLVMRRDDFKCCGCGRSPAMQPGLVLHVDHVHPWSRGGETVIENLQTLCEQCNIGKSDLSMQVADQA